MEKPIVIEIYADNGEHSHWELISIEDHSVIWSEDNETIKSDNKKVIATLQAELEKAKELLKDAPDVDDFKTYEQFIDAYDVWDYKRVTFLEAK